MSAVQSLPYAVSPPTPLRTALLSSVDGVAAVHETLDLIDTSLAVSPAALGPGVVAVERAIRRLQAVKLSMVTAAEQAKIAGLTGASGTSAWLATKTHSTGAAAAGQVALAAALDSGLNRTRTALADGECSVEHAGIIATTAAGLPKTLTDLERDRVEAHLVATAKLTDPAGLRKAARRALVAAQRAEAEVDTHEDALLRSEEDRAWDAARLTMHDNGDGTTTGRFVLPTLTASILRKIVQQIASPRRNRAEGVPGPATSGAAWAPGGVPSDSSAAGSQPPAWARAGTAQADTPAGSAEEGAPACAAVSRRRIEPPSAWSDVDWAQRHGQALVEVLEHLPTDRLHHKSAATIVVTISHERLKASLGAARTDTGSDLSASTARRLACQAGILPEVLGGASVPLDLGRSRRHFTEHQRVALAALYDACAAEDCDRPYAWTDLHHEDPWAASHGMTNLDRAVPLCGHHHRRVHDPRYTHHIRTGTTGKKSVSFRLRT